MNTIEETFYKNTINRYKEKRKKNFYCLPILNDDGEYIDIILPDDIKYVCNNKEIEKLISIIKNS